MHKLAVAEWLLTLCTSRERACSIVGDLSEEGHLRGAPWFWRHVAKIAVALVGRDLCSAPLRIALLAIGGYLLLFFQAYWSPFGALFLSGWHSPPVPSIEAYVLWMANVGWRAAIAPFLVALLMARLSAGREVASCAAIALVAQLPWIFVVAGLLWDGSVTELTIFEMNYFVPVVFSSLSLSLPLLAGAAVGRRVAFH